LFDFSYKRVAEAAVLGVLYDFSHKQGRAARQNAVLYDFSHKCLLRLAGTFCMKKHTECTRGGGFAGFVLVFAAGSC